MRMRCEPFELFEPVENEPQFGCAADGPWSICQETLTVRRDVDVAAPSSIFEKSSRMVDNVRGSAIPSMVRSAATREAADPPVALAIASSRVTARERRKIARSTSRSTSPATTWSP